jgi:hypothetical protein
MSQPLTCVFGLEQRCFERGVDLCVFEMSRQAFVVSLDRYFCGFLHFIPIECGSGGGELWGATCIPEVLVIYLYISTYVSSEPMVRGCRSRLPKTPTSLGTRLCRRFRYRLDLHRQIVVTVTATRGSQWSDGLRPSVRFQNIERSRYPVRSYIHLGDLAPMSLPLVMHSKAWLDKIYYYPFTQRNPDELCSLKLERISRSSSSRRPKSWSASSTIRQE